MYELATGGTLSEAIEEDHDSDDEEKSWSYWNSERQLDIAYQVTAALADLHSIGGDNDEKARGNGSLGQDLHPTVAHCDLGKDVHLYWKFLIGVRHEF